MTATLQDSQKEKESDSDTNNVDSVTTILTAKKMMLATVVKGPWKMIKIEVKRRVGRRANTADAEMQATGLVKLTNVYRQ
jgi:hypothetical protein